MRFYDLAAEDPEHRFSPFCWRVRLALAHKNLEAEEVPWRYNERHVIAFSGQGRVPIFVDSGKIIVDSWDIANYLEDRYPDRPSLFAHKDRTSALFLKHWTEAAIHPLIARIVMLDVLNILHEDDKAYFRKTREERYSMSLEAFTANPEQSVERLRAALEPLRATLTDCAFLGGKAPDFSDYIVFSAFQWARCVSKIPLLEVDDPIFYWREQLLHAFDGLAFRSPHRETTPLRKGKDL